MLYDTASNLQHCSKIPVLLKTKWLPNTSHNLDFRSGAEILVLNGSLAENGQRLCERDWIRFPVKTQTQLTSGPNGARIWVKTSRL